MNKSSNSNSNINWNIPDVDDSPPPAYEASAPPFNPHFIERPTSSSSSSNSHHPHYIEPTPITNNTVPATTPTFPNHNTNSNNNPHLYNTLYPQIPAIQHHSRPLYHPVQMPIPQTSTPPLRPQHYQSTYHTMPIPVSYTQSRQRERKGFPLAALFFLFGWFCPPLWVVGACCCASSRNEYEAWWGKVNFVMAMVLIVSSILFSAVTLSDYF